MSTQPVDDPEPESVTSAPEEAMREALESRVQKVSISMPSALVDLVRSRAGQGEFSRYVTGAVQERVRLDLLADLSAELEAEYGPVDEDQVEQAMREWPDFPEE
ncbi:MAG: hypothetical protein ACRDRJ_35800 [Streptosporangiaceae bacterium]